MKAFCVELTNGDEFVSAVIAAKDYEDAVSFVRGQIPDDLWEQTKGVKIYEAKATCALATVEGTVEDSTDLELCYEGEANACVRG